MKQSPSSNVQVIKTNNIYLGGSEIKYITISILGILLFVFSVGCSEQGESSNSWAYDFVNWQGENYVVNDANKVNKQNVGKQIGEVAIHLEREERDTPKNSSNIFKAGTKYFKLKETSTSEAIVVKQEGGAYIKAIHTSLWKEKNL
ncbi:hypothetical protein VKA52_06630 [Halobacillus sp. HZG1]|uniref:hypothetical protein n=1 Tax=Halobacillus sp. HZG1 TaxID=3111769 RepID=UPI002DB98C33|nr:hypothetical protein [Halobacillus sp. HZG1]MEC3883396.1 hypothetical protein [Halobacillus sp. HZG1]